MKKYIGFIYISCLTRTLIYPFDFFTWLMLALSIIVVALSLLLVNQESNIMEGKRGHRAEGFHIFSISVVTLINEALPSSWLNMRKSYL